MASELNVLYSARDSVKILMALHCVHIKTNFVSCDSRTTVISDTFSLRNALLIGNYISSLCMAVFPLTGCSES